MILNFKEIKQLINSSMLVYSLTHEDSIPYLEENELKHLCLNTDLNQVPDEKFLEDEKFIKYVDWTKLNKTKLLRLVGRNVKIADFVDLSSIEATIKEALPCIKMHPELLTKLGLDLSNLDKNDLLELFKTGQEYVFNHIHIDHLMFSNAEAFLIAKSFEFEEKVVMALRITTRRLNSQHMRELIQKTKEKYIQLMDLNILEPIDWIDILKQDRDMLKYCNPEVFLRGDPYYLVKFVCMFPEFKHLITQEQADRITALGWEELLIHYPNDFLHLCNFRIFSEINWSSIKRKRPELLVHKL